MLVLYAARHRVPVPSLARWLLGLGIAATLTANMAQGWSHGPVGAVVAASPAVSLVGSYELLVWLIRTSGTVEHRPPAGHFSDTALCRAVPRSAKAAATATEFLRRGERDTPDRERRPSARVAGPQVIPVSGQRDQAILDVGAVNDAAVVAYRLSAQAGNPLSERKLARMFGCTSRRWARARIAEARRVPSPRASWWIRHSPSAPRPRGAREGPSGTLYPASERARKCHSRDPQASGSALASQLTGNALRVSGATRSGRFCREPC